MIRALRQDARTLRYHLARFAFVLITAWFLTLAQAQASVFGAPGLSFFTSITWMTVIGITVASVSFFSSAITEEKEEKMLSLLRMAGISPVALLLGKSTSRLVSVALLLSVQFPFTLLAITLGGVTWHQVLAAYGAMIAYTVLLANLALFFSVICRTTHQASTLTAFTLIGVHICGGLLIGWIVSSNRDPQLVRWLEYAASASIFVRLVEMMATGFNESVFSFQVISNLVAAGVLFLLSWSLFDRFNREEHPDTPDRNPLFGRSGRRTRLSVGRPGARPLIWKDFHFIAGGKPMLVGKFIGYGILVAILAYIPFWTVGSIDLRELGGIAMGTMLAAFLVEITLLVARVFSEEVRWQTLSGLIMLPRSVREIAYSKLAGGLLGLIPCMFYFFAGALLAPDVFGDAIEGVLLEPGGLYFIVQVLFFLHLVAFFSLFARWGAIPAAFGVVVLLNGCFGTFAVVNVASAEMPFYVVMLVTAGVAMIVLQWRIAERLCKLASR